MEEQIVSGIILIITFLTIAVFSSVILKRINFPYTIGLVLVGGLFGILAYNYDALSLMRGIELSPGLILYIILPTLIFDAAIDIDARTLFRNLVPILLLAVFGLLISAGIIGVGLSFTTPLSISGALVFGALISATDPVAVIALFKEIGAPRRLVTLIDGESLFNDATAIVLFTILMHAFSGENDGSVHFLTSVGQFLIVLTGGLAVGAIIGYLGSLMLRLEKQNLLLQITVSLIMAYVSFIVADHYLHVSGVMSTLAAGLVMRLQSEVTIKRSNIETLEHFWDYFSFVANSFVFLLLGLTEIKTFSDSGSFKGVFISFITVIPLVVIARAASIYLLIPLYNRLKGNDEKERISLPYQAILFWGGLRGAVPVALVLAIPLDFPHRELIVHFTLGYILFTLLVQGTTIKRLMNHLGIKPDKSDFENHEVVTREYPFGSAGLASLVVNGVRKLFEAEGFFIRVRGDQEVREYLMKRGNTALLISHCDNKICMTAEPQNITYLNTVLYETLLDLNGSVEAIKRAADPEKMKELVTVETEHAELNFNVMQYLAAERMTVSLVSHDKESVLREMVQMLMHRGEINHYEEVLAEIIERENSMSTGMGMEIAMPHAKSDYVRKLTALIGISSHGVEFDALDGNPVKIFVMILSPKNDPGPHLQFLASMSKILANSETRDAIIAAQSTDELYRTIQSAALSE